MGKEANIYSKSSKTQVLFYRNFLKFGFACAIYTLYLLLIGKTINECSVPLTMSVLFVCLYTIYYYLYQVNGSKKKNLDQANLRIVMVTKLFCYFIGIGISIYSINLIHSKNILGYFFLIIGIILIHLLFKNKSILSNFSTFFENFAAAMLFISLENIYMFYKNDVSLWYLLSILMIVISVVSGEFAFYFYNIKKNSSGEKVNHKDLIKISVGRGYFTSVIYLIVCAIWSVFVFTGSIDTLIGADLYEKAIKIIPITISIIVPSITVYNNFFKKAKVEKVYYDEIVSPEKLEFKIKDKFKDKSALPLKALNYVVETMNSKNGYSRYTGENYYVHPIAVANILMENAKCSSDTIAVALLHDCIEDIESVNEEYIKNNYSEKIAKSVKLLSKEPSVDYHERKNLLSYLNAIFEDKDALCVKIADRMNNSSTMYGQSQGKKDKKSEENKEVYEVYCLKAQKSSIHKDNIDFYKKAEVFFNLEVK